MAGEIALFLINQVLEETPSTWVPGDPLYPNPLIQDEEEDNVVQHRSVYVRPMFELLYDDPDDHPFEFFFGTWDQRRSSYRWLPPRSSVDREPKVVAFHTTEVQDVSVIYMDSDPVPSPHVLTALATWRLD